VGLDVAVDAGEIGARVTRVLLACAFFGFARSGFG